MNVAGTRHSTSRPWIIVPTLNAPLHFDGHIVRSHVLFGAVLKVLKIVSFRSSSFVRVSTNQKTFEFQSTGVSIGDDVSNLSWTKQNRTQWNSFDKQMFTYDRRENKNSDHVTRDRENRPQTKRNKTIEINFHSKSNASFWTNLNSSFSLNEDSVYVLLTDDYRYDENGEQMNAYKKSVTKIQSTRKTFFFVVFLFSFRLTVCSKSFSTI